MSNGTRVGRGRRGSRSRLVSASDLAVLGYCERKVVFNRLHGKVTTEAQAAAQDEGNERHARFHEEGQQLAAAGSGRRWCFVATLVLGECEETRQLRAYRDVVLRRTLFGRALVLAYYRVAPGTCRQLERWPRAISLLRAPLRAAARWAQQRVERRIEKEASNVVDA